MRRVLLAGLAAAILWVYAATLRGLVAEWISTPEASYGILLAAVALATAWHRRRALAPIDSGSSPAPGGALLVLGAAIYLVGQLGADVFLTRISVVFVVAGALGSVGGAQWLRVLAAPVMFALLAVPLPSLVVNAVTAPLQLFASAVTEVVLRSGGFAVYREGNLLTLPSTTLEVAEACSGFRSLISLFAVGAILAWMDHTWWRRAGIVAVTVPLAIVMNTVRIVAVAVCCELWGAKMATGAWHTATGWLAFVASVVILDQFYRLLLGKRHDTIAPLAPTPTPAAAGVLAQ